MIGQRNERGVETACIAAREVGARVARVDLQALLGKLRRLVGKELDAFAMSSRDVDLACGRQEGIVRVVGGVEQVLVIELTEDRHHQVVAVGHGVVRVLLDDLVEARDGAVVVKVIEVPVGVADGGVEVQWIGMGGGLLLRISVRAAA